MLKQLLQQLLNTRTTPTQAAHNAAPGSGDIGINGTEYICPSDGYVTALANGAAAGGFNLTLKRNGLNVQGGPQTIQFAEWVQANMIPVAKGDKVNLELYNQNVWEWRFIPAIGGGYNILVWRALSCLRALSNYLQRGFCKINIQTLPINAAQVQQLRINQSLEVANKTLLLHLVVGPYFRLAGIMHLPISGSGLKTPQERLATYQTRLHLGSGLQFQSRKETPSSLILVLTQAQGILSLFVTNRLNNFASGGEAC